MPDPFAPIAISALQHWRYCPRQYGLIHLEQVFAENVFTQHGQALHKRVDDPGIEIRDGLRVTASMVLPAGQGPETVVMEPAAPVWVSDAVVTRAGDSLTATADLVPLPGQPFDLDPATLRLTMLSTGRAIEVTGCPLH